MTGLLVLHRRLSGREVLVNPALIGSVEASPERKAGAAYLEAHDVSAPYTRLVVGGVPVDVREPVAEVTRLWALAV